MLKGVSFGGNTLNKYFLILVAVSPCQVTENTSGYGMAAAFAIYHGRRRIQSFCVSLSPASHTGQHLGFLNLSEVANTHKSFYSAIGKDVPI